MEWTRRSLLGGLAATIVPLRAAAKPVHPGVSSPSTGGFMVLEARPGTMRLAPPPASPTAVWAYNGQMPGPLIRVRLGDEVKVRLVNRLAEPTSLCWHGVRIANAMDGVAGLTQPPVAPGASFDYRFTPPDAGFYWYHPHIFPQSAEQIGRGLYGLLIVDETTPPDVDRDMLVVLNDWSLDANGAIKPDFLDKATASGAGRIGANLTVNERAAPRPFEVRPRARVRLRILNACSARIAIVTCAGMDVAVVAIDGQPSEVFPPAAGMIPVGPGSRFEVIADMPAEPGKSPALLLRGDGAPDQLLMVFSTKGGPVAARHRAVRLPPNPLLPERIPLEKALKRDLVLAGGVGGAPIKPEPSKRRGRGKPTAVSAPPAVAADSGWLWTIDGRGSDGVSGEPLFRVKRGTPVSLAFVNRTGFVQQMHVHGHVFRVLHDLDDGWDPYWRESILVGPGKTKHVAFIADNPGKWPVESLVLARQVTGMAGWFEVS